jgi:hypothetical protein
LIIRGLFNAACTTISKAAQAYRNDIDAVAGASIQSLNDGGRKSEPARVTKDADNVEIDTRHDTEDTYIVALDRGNGTRNTGRSSV